MRLLYEPFTRNHDRLIVMDVRSAELSKYAANAMLATKISFMNELANLAERFGADIEKVRIGIGSDPRIGYSFIYPGCGYGGSCFPKDVKALARSAQDMRYDAQVLKSVESVNKRQKELLFRKMRKFFDGALKGKTIAVWGLAFKPNTDDMREAPSRTLMEALWKEGARVKAYDPVAGGTGGAVLRGKDKVRVVDSLDEAVADADAAILVTRWEDFRALPELLSKRSPRPLLVDGRRMLERGSYAPYAGVGLGPAE